MKNYLWVCAFLLCSLLLQVPAYADIGVPLVAVFLPPMWLLLIPVILLEAFLLGRLLSLGTALTLLPSAVGNIATTIVGVPFTWLLLVLLCH